ncbi:MAG TPA: DUF58 domain-containing protein [Acidimicrobiia bacterium]
MSAVALYVLGLVLGYEELFVLAAAAIIALIGGAGWIALRPNLEVHREIEPRRVTRGDPALGLVRVTNRSPFPSVPAIATEPCGPTTVQVEIPRLAKGASIAKRYRLPTDRRAVIDVGPIAITRADPLGLWRTRRRHGDIERLWVHPRTFVLFGLPAGRTRSLDGQAADAVEHGSITFHALREYVVGDDLRHVHWKSSARVGSLMVREHVDTSLPQLTLLLDTRSSAYDEESFETAIEAVASIAVTASRQGFPLRLVTTCGRSAGGRGIGADAAPLLDLLAGIQAADDVDLRSVVARLARERRGDTFVAVTGRTDTDDIAPVASMARRFDDAALVMIADDADARIVSVPRSVLVLRASSAEQFASRWNTVVR